MTAAVEVDRVSRRFGTTAAVDDVSLTIREGEFVSLLGPSGCGKTTLLRLIGGFESPDSGRIRLLGHDVTDAPPNRRRTNMVFQHLALFPHMSVAENIAFGLSVRGGLAATEIHRRVEEALALVRLHGFGARRIDQLSGGQKQRVAIARAVVNEPAVLLLDEPLGALDLQLRLELQGELRRLQRTLGSPFVFVTHDQGEAMAMSDRVAVMQRGRIIQDGTPRDIYENPKTLFVARFLGLANILEGRVVERRDSRSVVLDVDGMRLDAEAVDPVDRGDPAVAVIRYENVTIRPLASATETAIDSGEPATVVDLSYLGAATRASLRLDRGLAVNSEFPAALSPGPLAVGDCVVVSWQPSAARVFTGKADAV